MAELNFTKLHASGQDFIVYADPHSQMPLDAADIAKLCNRATGVGATHLIRAVKTAHHPRGQRLLREYPEAEWFLDCYESDGAPSTVSASAIQAYVHFLLSTELLVLADRRETFAIATTNGVKDVLAGFAGYSVDLGKWRSVGTAASSASWQLAIDNKYTVYDAAGVTRSGSADTAAVTALLQAVDCPARILLCDFATQQVKDGVATLCARYFKDGAELPADAEAAVAAALTARAAMPGLPHHWKIAMPGGVLGVRMFPTEEGEHVSASGPVVTVYHGTVSL